MSAPCAKSYRTRIKICGLTRERDLEAAVAAGVDAVGLVFYPPSPRSVSVDQAARLTKSIPAWVSVVGLFVNTTAHDVKAVADVVGLSHIQLHGDEKPEDFEGLGRPVIKAIRLPHGASQGATKQAFAKPNDQAAHLIESKRWRNQVQAVLFDADSAGFGGSGHSFDWALLSDAWQTLGNRWVLSGGLNPHNVVQALDRLHPPAVDVSSGVEELEDGRPKKGFKDFNRMHAFVQAVREFDRRKDLATAP